MSQLQQDLTTRASDAVRLDRRALLTGAVAFTGAAGTVSAALGRDYGTDQPQRYPDPDVVILDDRFAGKVWNTSIERLFTGTLWAEGPAWNGVGRYLIWNDIPGNETLRWLEEDDHVSRRFRSPSGYANGNTFDYEGRQIACQHETRRVVRYEHDGQMTVLADTFEENGFNAPNDVVVHPNDGSIWFTDAGYGSLAAYEGNRLPEAEKSPQPLRKEAVYRIDAGGKITMVADQPFKPNGLCFSNDYKRLYVSDTGTTHYPEAKDIIWVFDLGGERLSNPRTFVSMEMDGKTGAADGLRCDEEGNVWVAAGWVGDGYDGVHVFAPDGKRIGQIRLPEVCANLCFGGSKRNRLFMAASQSLYACYVATRGAHIT